LDEKGLRKLQSGLHRGIALQSRWEELRRAAKAKAQRVNGGRIVVDRADVREFLGFVEGRLFFKLPDWWRDGLTEVELWQSNNGITPFAGREPEQKPRPSIRVDDRYWVPMGMDLVEQVEPRFQLVGNGERIAIPNELLSPFVDEEQPSDDISINAITGGDGGEFVTIHNAFPKPYEIYSLSIKNGESTVSWRSPVWVESPIVYGRSGGTPEHLSALLLNDTEVAVIGLCPESAYIELFSRTTGESLFRFSTSY